MTDRARIERLVRALREDMLPNLSDREIELVLGWLAGSQSGPDADGMKDLLGAAGEDRALTSQLLQQLDAVLFRDGRLGLNAAGLAALRDPSLARRRFRLLLSAFHPDRMQWHADWLTPRFQAINQAYRDFKLNPESESKALQRFNPADARAARPRYQGIAPDQPGKPARWRLWAQDRWLAHKIVGVMSLIVVLPLLSWSLDEGWLSSLVERRQVVDGGGMDGDASAAAARSDSAYDSGDYERMARAPGSPITVASLLEHWSLALAAEHGETAELATRIPSSAPEPADALNEDPGPAPAATSAAPAQVAQPGTCQPSAPAARFGGWLASAAHWTLAEVPIGARPSRLRAGAIEGHALADALENYRRSVEAGNLGQLLRNYVEAPRANTRQGERWLQETYGALFDDAARVSLSLEVVEAYRHADGWNLITRYQLGVRLRGCPTDHVFEQELRFYLVQDPLLFRIAAVDYE